MVLDQLDAPVILAPLGGGPSTPELAAAVSNAGGLAFLAAGYLSSSQVAERVKTTRTLTDRPIGVNVFVPGSGPAEPAAYAGFVRRLERWRPHGPAATEQAPLGEARYSDDDWEAKIALLRQESLPVVSFTFGCPDREVMDGLRSAGSEVWITVTSPEEADEAEQAGVDVLVVQGAEAGGHRASFSDRGDIPLYGLLPLLSLVQERSSRPLVASGGIATGRALAAVLCAGAGAAQIGTAFMLSPEAGTAQAHRVALRSERQTALTRAFTGRLARGIRNRFLDEHSAQAPIAYPELHYVTAPLRQRARDRGDAELVNLWAGEAHALAREVPAGEIVRGLVAEAETALREAEARLSTQGDAFKPGFEG